MLTGPVTLSDDTSETGGLNSILRLSDSGLPAAARLACDVKRLLNEPTSARPGTCVWSKAGVEHRRLKYSTI